jgi:hypothetical protein
VTHWETAGERAGIDLERLLADLPGLLVDLLLELDYAGGLARQGFWRSAA